MRPDVADASDDGIAPAGQGGADGGVLPGVARSSVPGWRQASLAALRTGMRISRVSRRYMVSK